MAVGDFVAESLGVVLNRITVYLNSILILKNPFTGVKRILRSMKQTELNNWFSVVAVLVEPFRAITVKGMTTPRALISLKFNSNLIKAIISDKNGKGSICPVVVLPNRGFAAVRTGPRVSDPLALKPTEPVLRRTNYTTRYEAVQSFFSVSCINRSLQERLLLHCCSRHDQNFK